MGEGRFSYTDLVVADAFADALRLKLSAAGIHVLHGPWLRRPPVWRTTERAADRDMMRRLNSVGLHLTDDARVRYHVALSKGQGYDDATGFWLRCWAAAFAFPFKPAWISRSSLPSPSPEKPHD